MWSKATVEAPTISVTHGVMHDQKELKATFEREKHNVRETPEIYKFIETLIDSLNVKGQV